MAGQEHMNTTDNVVPIQTPVDSTGGNGTGGSDDRLRQVELKLATIENEIRHLAKESDIQSTKTYIEKKFSDQLKWLLGTMISVIVASVGVVLFVLRTYD